MNETTEERPPLAVEANVTVITQGTEAQPVKAAVTSTPLVKNSPNTSIANGMSPIVAKQATGTKPKQAPQPAPRQAPQKKQVTQPTAPQNSPQVHAAKQSMPVQQQANVKQPPKQMVQKRTIPNQPAAPLPGFNTITQNRQQLTPEFYNKIEPFELQTQQQQSMPQKRPMNMQIPFHASNMPMPPSNVLADIMQNAQKPPGLLNELKQASSIFNGYQQPLGQAQVLNIQNLPALNENQYVIVNPEQAPPAVSLQQPIRRLSVKTTDPVTQRQVLKQVNVPQAITMTKTKPSQQQQGIKRSLSSSIPSTPQAGSNQPQRSKNGLFVPEPLEQSYDEQSSKVEYYENELRNLKMKYNSLVQHFNSMIQREQTRSNKAREIVNGFMTFHSKLKEFANL